MVAKIQDMVSKTGMYKTLGLLISVLAIISAIGYSVYASGADRIAVEVKEVRVKVDKVEDNFIRLDTVVSNFIFEQRTLTNKIVTAIEKIRDN